MWLILNLFTVGLSSKFARRLVPYFPQHLKRVIILPCAVQKIIDTDNLDVFNTIS